MMCVISKKKAYRTRNLTRELSAASSSLLRFELSSIAVFTQAQNIILDLCTHTHTLEIINPETFFFIIFFLWKNQN